MNPWRKKKLPWYVLIFVFMWSSSLLITTNPAQAADSSPAAGAAVVVHSRYSDVPSSDANAIYINFLNNRGIISGYPDGTFHPHEGLSRAQAATIMVKAAGLAIDPDANTAFSDVSQDYWARAYIAAAEKAGYIKGIGDGSYHPDETLSRAQAISLLLRLSRQDLSRAKLPAGLTDIDNSHWAAQSVAAGLTSGMVGLSDDGKQYLPDAPFSRINLAHALGVLLTEDPGLYAATLEGALKVKKGIIKIKTAGSQEEQQIQTETTVKAGDIITSGADSSAELNYPDGSSMLIEENTHITVVASEGRKYIKTDGSEGTAVDWLDIKIKQGTLFGGLATRHESSPNEDKKTGRIQRPKSGLIASLQGIGLIAAEDEELPWYAASEEKKVKIQVDMPWGVAAIRGTFIVINVSPGGQSTVSCLTGDAEVTNGGTTVDLTGNQTTQVTQAGAPPPPPTPMAAAQVQQFVQAQDWIQETAEIMDQVQEAPPASPPAAEPVEQPATTTTVPTTTPTPTAPTTTPAPSTVDIVNRAMSGSTGTTTTTTTTTTTPATPGATPGSGGGGGGGGGGGSSDSATIVSINNLTGTVEQGVAYELPETVTAHMSNNTTKQVAVTWNTGNPDTSVAGIVTITGSVSRYANPITLVITIAAKIERIEDLTASIKAGDNYNLPVAVTARMSDESSREVAISWSASSVDTSQAGEYIFQGTVLGYEGTVRLILTIEPLVIENIENLTARIKAGDNYNLPVAVTARMSDESSREVAISWSASNVDTSQAGEYIFQGTVEGYAGTVSLTLIIEPLVTIENIENLTANIKAGESFNLPVTVIAHMSDGSTKELPVSWSASSVDTSQAGEYIFQGTVEGYAGTVNLTLTIEPLVIIESIENLAASIKAGESFSLPVTVTAHMSDGSSKELPVSWNASTIDTSRAGAYTYQGTVAGYEGTVSLTLTIKPLVRIESIDNPAPVSVQQGNPYTLPSSLIAHFSDGTSQAVPVVWNPPVAQTNTTGSYSFSGIIEGYSGVVIFSLNVFTQPVVIPVESVTLPEFPNIILADGTYMMTRSLSDVAADVSLSVISSNEAVATAGIASNADGRKLVIQPVSNPSGPRVEPETTVITITGSKSGQSASRSLNLTVAPFITHDPAMEPLNQGYSNTPSVTMYDVQSSAGVWSSGDSLTVEIHRENPAGTLAGTASATSVAEDSLCFSLPTGLTVGTYWINLIKGGQLAAINDFKVHRLTAQVKAGNTSIGGTGVPGDTITVYRDGTGIGTGTVAAGGNFSVAITTTPSLAEDDIVNISDGTVSMDMVVLPNPGTIGLDLGNRTIGAAGLSTNKNYELMLPDGLIMSVTTDGSRQIIFTSDQMESLNRSLWPPHPAGGILRIHQQPLDPNKVYGWVQLVALSAGTTPAGWSLNTQTGQAAGTGNPPEYSLDAGTTWAPGDTPCFWLDGDQIAMLSAERDFWVREPAIGSFTASPPQVFDLLTASAGKDLSGMEAVADSNYLGRGSSTLAAGDHILYRNQNADGGWNSWVLKTAQGTINPYVPLTTVEKPVNDKNVQFRYIACANEVAGPLVNLSVLASAPPVQEERLINNWNGDGITNNPPNQAVFTVYVPYALTYIDTYHCGANPAAAGTISLQSHQDGTVYGPWNAVLDVTNNVWVVNNKNPEQIPATVEHETALDSVASSVLYPVIPAGSYTVIDSCPSTWSYNSGSGNAGFVQLKGYRLESQPGSEYRVIYNGNGHTAGNVPGDTQVYSSSNSTVTVQGNTGSMAQSGFTFVGWNTAADGSGNNYNAGSTFTISANTTLFAQWTSSTPCTLTYNANGGTGTVPTGGTYNINDTVTVTSGATLSMSDCTFIGWNTAADWTGTDYSPGNTFPITADMTLYAKWQLTTSPIAADLGFKYNNAKLEVSNNALPAYTTLELFVKDTTPTEAGPNDPGGEGKYTLDLTNSSNQALGWHDLSYTVDANQMNYHVWYRYIYGTAKSAWVQDGNPIGVMPVKGGGNANDFQAVSETVITFNNTGSAYDGYTLYAIRDEDWISLGTINSTSQSFTVVVDDQFVLKNSVDGNYSYESSGYTYP